MAKQQIKFIPASKIRRIEPHQAIVPRMSMVEREKLPKVDAGFTYDTYANINFNQEEIEAEKEAARTVIATMDSDSARRYDI